MTTPPKAVAGACLCGAVRFEVEPPTTFCAHCHCTMCRRSHGAAYVTWFGVPDERFRILSGDDVLVTYQSSDHGTRSFCGRCGSSLFCRIDSHPGTIDVVLANLEGEIDQPPSAHIFYSDRASWVEANDDLPKLGGDLGMEPLD